MRLKHSIFWLLCVLVSIVHGENTDSPYTLESGEVIYEIYGGGIATPECNLSISGSEKLIFKQWGKKRLEKMERTEILDGSLQSFEKQNTLKKIEHGLLFIVDDENERILKSNLVEGDIGRIDLNDMQKSGVMNIASYECEVWEGSNRKVCLHQGIILMDEKHYLGFSYGKRAIQIAFDRDLSDKAFELPLYEEKEDLLMRSTVKTTQTYRSETISDRIIHAKGDIDPSDKMYPDALNEFLVELFEKEKKYLPLLLKSMRKTRACLYSAQSHIEANKCLYEVYEIKAKFNKNKDNTLSIWVDDTKEKILNDFDDTITKLEMKLPCINRSLNIMDLSSCMK